MLIAETHEDVTILNRRARADLIHNKTLNPDREVELRDGTAAGVGDTIITRDNDRKLRTANGRDWRNAMSGRSRPSAMTGLSPLVRDYELGPPSVRTGLSRCGGVGEDSAAASSASLVCLRECRSRLAEVL